MDISSLKKNCKGVVSTKEDANFKEMLYGDLWNRLVPDRAPQILVRVEDEQDVIAAIRFARENKLKVVVRGGGHNWCQPTLRKGGLLIDLVNLHKIISIDAKALKAVVQPIISNRDAQKTLNALGLAFPTGHCPQVKLSGYLLGGGMSWNQNGWGHGFESVEAIELVTAQGEHITASKDQNQEYFWAARGGATGFFGVVTRYHLKLHPLPKAIHTVLYYYSIEDSTEAAAWFDKVGPQLASTVELSLFLLTAPPEMKHSVAAHGRICLVSATSFADSVEQAKAELKPLEACPVKSLSSVPAFANNFEALFDASGALWPEGLRSRVQSTFSNSNAGDIVEAMAGHFLKAPSPLTLILLVFPTGQQSGPRADAAFSRYERINVGPWTQWKTAEEDAANNAWHDECVARMVPFIDGYYIGEANSAADTAVAKGSLSPENWNRLAELRTKLDPDGVFFTHTDGF